MTDDKTLSTSLHNAKRTDAIVDMVVDSVTSIHSKRAYSRALVEFLDWYEENSFTLLTKAVVQKYKTHLMDARLSPSTVNQKMSAIRKLAKEAADNGLVDPVLAIGISEVKGVKSSGVRTGNWLSPKQAEHLIEAPDTTRLKGIRDQAILAIMIGSGIRRSEVANPSFKHVQMRDNRWAIVDLVGKGNRVRTVPIPAWAKSAIDRWIGAAGIHPTPEGRVFRSIRKNDAIGGSSITPQGIYEVVIGYAEELGYQLAAHDLRRTFAKLARKGGAGLEQIQLSLGHASVNTTERYLGVEQDLQDAPSDRLGISPDLR
jgi:site-specific recombinase XerD